MNNLDIKDIDTNINTVEDIINVINNYEKEVAASIIFLAMAKSHSKGFEKGFETYKNKYLKC